MTQVANMMFIACALKATLSLKIADRGIAPEFTEACAAALEKLDQNALAKCDEKSHYSEKIITALSKADSQDCPAAEEGNSDMVGLLENCGGVSADCAEAAAPLMIMETQMDGTLLTQECQDEAQSKMDDYEAGKYCTAEQEQAKQIALSNALSDEDADYKASFDLAGEYMVDCMDLSKKCAYEFEGILIKSILEPEPQQVEVFVNNNAAINGIKQHLAAAKNMEHLPKRMRTSLANLHLGIKILLDVDHDSNFKKTLKK